MKNRFLTLIAVLIGLSTALITQSFTSVEPNKWGNDEGEMVDISTLTGRDDNPIPAPNTYRCDSTEEEVICSGTYVGTPTEPEQLTDTELGIFSKNL